VTFFENDALTNVMQLECKVVVHFKGTSLSTTAADFSEIPIISSDLSSKIELIGTLLNYITNRDRQDSSFS